jgi:hypothetical protein
MWRLLSVSLRYHRATLLVSWAIGLAVSFLVLGLVAWLDSKTYLAVLEEAGMAAPISVLVASMVAGFIFTGAESEEKRLQLTATLPLHVREVAFHRAFLPVTAMLLGCLLSAVIMVALLALDLVPLTAAHLKRAALIAAELSYWVQLPLMIVELKNRLKTGRSLQALGPATVLIVLSSVVVWAELLASAQVLELPLVCLASVTMLLCNFVFFQHRTSFR